MLPVLTTGEAVCDGEVHCHQTEASYFEINICQMIFFQFQGTFVRKKMSYTRDICPC